MPTPPLPVVLDCDTGIDDALALLYLVARPDLDLVAVGSVHGNVPSEVGAANTLQVLDAVGATHVPVALGARRPLAQPLMTAEFVHGPDGLGGAAVAPDRPVSGESAVEQLCRLARSRPGELTVLAVGPLTNLALALLAEPELPTLVREVVVMGGAFGAPGNVGPQAEANIWHDPEAARLVFAAPWRVRAVGLDVTNRTLLGGEQLQPIADSDRPGPRLAWAALQFYLDFYEARVGVRACSLHDPLAAMVVTRPDLVTWEQLAVDVELRGELTRGATIVDRRATADRDPAWPLVEVATTVDNQAAVKLFVDTVVGA